MSEFFSFFVAEFAEGQPVEILRVGEFIDVRGTEVKIEPNDLDTFVKNFGAGEAGQDVPVDVLHQRAEAAGWVVRVWREGDKLLGQIDWNALGQQLVGERIYRYLSASIDLAKKVVRSVSLVNFPAIKGLRPVELSAFTYDEGGGRIEDDANTNNLGLDPICTNQEDITMGENTQTPPEEINLEELRASIRAKIEADMAQKEKTLVEMREQVRAEVEVEMAERFERRQKLAEFAAELCGETSVALSAKSDEVVEFLAGLDDDQVERAKTLLCAKVVDFGERGSSRPGQSEGKEKLSPAIVRLVRQWLGAGKTLPEFFEVNAELGEMDSYDLAEFSEEG
jgi:hypothetical protein